MSNAIIIGAGPAGLTAACELVQKTDIRPIVVEQEAIVGGLARTMQHHGCRIDIGGHRFFTKDARIQRIWQELLPLQGTPSMDDRLLHRPCALQDGGPDPDKTDAVMLLRTRLSRILYDERFFSYPVTLGAELIENLGPKTIMAILGSYLSACIRPRIEKTLEDFFINRFGRKLYELFFRDYTCKVWGRYPDGIDASWGSQRIKGVSIKKALAHIFRKDTENETSFIDTFWYPKYGPGQLWDAMAMRIEANGGIIIRNARVLQILGTKDRLTGVWIETPGGERTIKADYIFSSMPVAELAPALPKDMLTKEAMAVAKALPYRDFITVGILADKIDLTNETDRPTLGDIPPDCWIYIQEPHIHMGRLQIFNNWSPYLVKDPLHQVWLGLEYFAKEGDPFWQMDDESFIQMAEDELETMGILSKHHVKDAVRYRVKKAYPAYFDAYEDFPKVRHELDKISNLYCIGRNGQHRYNNMDHSMLTAIEAVRNLMEHLPDKENIWNVNTESDYHEREAAKSLN